MKLFSTAPAIYSEIQKMVTAERYRREDRATVSNFFNGAPPLTDAEAEDLGITVNVNNLFGHSDLTRSKEQVFSVFTKPARLIEVDLDAAPPGKREDWRMAAQEEATRVLRKVRNFKTAYEGVCGDASLHGEAVFFYPNPTFPLPRQVPLSKMLVPESATTDASELSHFCIEAEIKLPALNFYYSRAPKGWNKAALGKLLDGIYKDILSDGRTLDPNNLEEMEYRRQENSAAPNYERQPEIKVWYFYQQRADLSGNPYDLDVLVKIEDQVNRTKEDFSNSTLYSGQECYANIDACLHPLFMDCIIGGEPKWHRILGLGHLNYQLNQAIEILINRAHQGTMESSMNIWQAKDSATREAVQQILLKNNGVVPEGVSLIQNRFQPNLQGVLEMIQFFRQKGSENAIGMQSNSGDKNDQLQVQALYQQNQSASAQNSRMSNWYDYLDRMWAEAFSRLACPFVEPNEHGYSEAMDFQAAMKRKGIPLWYLQRSNVQVRSVRIIGDGLRAKELSAAAFLKDNRSSYAPEVQPRITRIITALTLDNYKLAEDLTPMQEEEDSPQTLRAETENAIMTTQRIPVKPLAEDVDEVHIMQHFPAMDRIIADAVQFQKASFTPQQHQAFMAIGAHAVAHIQRLEARAGNGKNDPDRQKAAAFMAQLNEMASMAEKLAHNMQQQQDGQGEEMSPNDMAKLKIQVEQLQLQRDKLQHGIEKFSRTQSTREQAMAFDQVMKMEKNRRDGMAHARDTRATDTELALKVSAAGPKQATESISVPYDKLPEDVKRQVEASLGFNPSKLPPPPKPEAAAK